MVRPRLSVCCLTGDPGARVAEALSPLREVAAEIVVAVDARVDPERLGLYESVADTVVRFEFGSFVERSLEWMRSLCSGDWIFRLDGDEVASPALIATLPRLIEADDVLQYWLPCRWVDPDGSRWLDEWPWWPDFSNRLVRNDARLRFDGLAHSAEADFPARYVEEPFYHLLCALAPKPERERKLAYYANLDSSLKAKDSDRLLRTFYLPEEHAVLKPVAIPEEDLHLVEAALRAGDATEPTRSEAVRLFERAEIDRVWAQRPLAESGYRASLEPLSAHRWMPPGEHRPFRVRVRNEGDARWPGGHGRDPLIRLSYRWRSLAGDLVVAEGFRSPLPAPLGPRESCIAPLIVAAPEEPGEYLLEVDLVHEHVRWFDCAVQVEMSIEPERPSRGGPGRLRDRRAAREPARGLLAATTSVAADRPATADADASVTVLDRYRWMTAGWRTPFHVLARNLSGDTWPGTDRERPIRLGYRWLRPGTIEIVSEGFRTAFPASIEPGAEAIVPMLVEAPVLPGRYLLEIDVVHEFVRWFGRPAQVEIEVRDVESAPAFEVPQRAPEWLASADREFFDRVTRLCGLDHDEALTLLFQPGPPVDVPIPPLAGHPVRLRPARSDVRVLDDTIWGRYHLPPPEHGAPSVIVDLGANIGLTMVHFAFLFPDARIVGVELDGENAMLARRNVAPWSDRCTVVEAAIWSSDGELTYGRESDDWGYRVGGADENERTPVKAVALDTLLDSVAPNQTVDYLKVDIEGAERELFKGGGTWTERVRLLKVETHEPYSVDECIDDLSRLGFSAFADGGHWAAVVARRTDYCPQRAVRPT
jgi:FkbM family methyltransferase